MEEENAYEHLLSKVNEGRRQRGEDEVGQHSGSTPKKVKLSEANNKQPSTSDPKENLESQETAASFEDESMILEMEVMVAADSEFPEEEIQFEDRSVNNNATVGIKRSSLSAAGSHGMTLTTQQQLLGLKDVNPDSDLQQTFALMQNFMLKKGLINSTMSQQEMQEFMEVQLTGDRETLDSGNKGDAAVNINRRQAADQEIQGEAGKSKGQGRNSTSCSSEITIYKRVVRSLDPNLETQLDDLLGKVRAENASKRKVSYSSDENMDTSDETIGAVSNELNLVDKPQLGRSADPAYAMEPQQNLLREGKSTDEQANDIVKEAEHARAHMFEVPGELASLNVSVMDQDYQMIDTHVDESFKKKILNYEYVDFSKLIAHNRVLRKDNHQRLEIINKNGVSFLSPVSDKDALQITSYGHWEQAFRVFSNILTSKFLQKAPELLQYNHTIHSASTAYIWENVYMYDREFRQHISHHPHHPWNVILQQAWTMILKDRLRGESSYSHKGNRQNKRDREPHKRFNRGKCSYGLSCKFDHRCSVPKCGKFGHGAHICRMKNTTEDASVPATGLPTPRPEK